MRAGDFERDADSGLLLPRGSRRRGVLHERPQFMCGPAFFGGGVTDPYFSSVSLLLHMDGANGSTSIVDSSSSPKSATCAGTAKLTTNQSRFGGASALFAANGDAVIVPNDSSLDMGSGDFTIEFWVSRSATPVDAYGCIAKRANSGNYSPFIVEILPSNTIRAQASTTGTSWVSVPGSVTLSLATFVHCAFVRNAGTLRLFVNGVADGTAAISGSLMTNTSAVSIGSDSGVYDYALNGCIDELRITKGVCRYSAAFTPPSTAFPNS